MQRFGKKCKRLFVYIMATVAVATHMPCSAYAQDSVSRCNIEVGSAVVGEGLIAAGSLFTFVPVLHGICVDLRDAVQADNHRMLGFDNYIQYLPAAMAVALGIGKGDLRNTLFTTSISHLTGAIMVNGVKWLADVQSPDSSSFNSFPSGHTFTAVVGAELLRRQCGEDCPAIVVVGYVMAATTAFMRVYNNRHWVADLLAGAGIGVLSVDFAYWANCKIQQCLYNKKRTAKATCNDEKGYLLD